jgi:hypothetical protein
MKAIRHIITPKTRNLQITLPDSLVDEKLEVIILAIEDSADKKENTYKSLKGKLPKDEADKMLAHANESRKEWQ